MTEMQSGRGSKGVEEREAEVRMHAGLTLCLWKDCEIQDEGAAKLAEALASNSTVTSIDLRGEPGFVNIERCEWSENTCHSGGGRGHRGRRRGGEREGEGREGEEEGDGGIEDGGWLCGYVVRQSKHCCETEQNERSACMIVRSSLSTERSQCQAWAGQLPCCWSDCLSVCPRQSNRR